MFWAVSANVEIIVSGEIGFGGDPSAAAVYGYIAGKFETLDHLGPISVQAFVAETGALAGRTADQWQQDAFGQVDAWLRALGLRG